MKNTRDRNKLFNHRVRSQIKSTYVMLAVY